MHHHSNLFVKNIPKEIDEDVLQTLFQTYGCVVSCRILQSRYPGSNNVGFVKFGSLEEAKLAIDYMHLATVENAVIEVRFADQDVGEKRAALEGREDRPYASGDHAGRMLYVKGFPRSWRDEDLMDYISHFGDVVRARILNSRETGNRGGKVIMATIEDAAMVVEGMHGRTIAGGDIQLSVTLAHPEAAQKRVIKREHPNEIRYAPYAADRPKRKQPPPPPPKQPTPLGTVVTQAAIQSSNLCPVIGHRFRLERDDARTPKQESAPPLPDYRYVSNSVPQTPHPHIKQEQHPETDDSVMPRDPSKTSLYIRNLPHDVDELRLYQLFGHFGGVRSVKRLPDRECSGRGGVGFVNYIDNPSAAQASFEMNGLKIGNHVLIISLQAHPTYSR